jgi:hypothetical protein
MDPTVPELEDSTSGPIDDLFEPLDGHRAEIGRDDAVDGTSSGGLERDS